MDYKIMSLSNHPGLEYLVIKLGQFPAVVSINWVETHESVSHLVVSSLMLNFSFQDPLGHLMGTVSGRQISCMNNLIDGLTSITLASADCLSTRISNLRKI